MIIMMTMMTTMMINKHTYNIKLAVEIGKFGVYMVSHGSSTSLKQITCWSDDLLFSKGEMTQTVFDNLKKHLIQQKTTLGEEKK